MSVEKEFFNPTKIVVREVEKSLAEDMIVKNHYSHKWSLCQVAYGIFFVTDVDCVFVDAKEEKYIGCMVFGQPVGRSAAESVSELIKVDEVFELTRLFIHDGYGSNIESYCLTKALAFIRKKFPHIKAVITYADNEYGHHGTIYQACGFHYQGNSSLALMPNFSISLVGPPYKWIHSRTVTSTYNSCNIEHLKKRIGHTFWRKKESTKHRYVCLLGNKIEKKRILANLKHPFQPYPKNTTYADNIQEIVVENPTENSFFS
jgi:hypothetical protein